MMDQQTPKKPSKKKKSKRFLVGYTVALFLVASVLIVFSYLSNARLAQTEQQLTEKTQVAAGFESRLQQVSAANAMLEEQVAALNEELAVTKSTLSETSYAYEILWKLIKAEDEKDTDACLSYLKQASELDMETLLSETGFAEYTRIKSKFKGA